MPARGEELAYVRVFAGRADVGRRRKHNEDAVVLRADLGLFVVADGAGGHAAGEVASNMCVNAIAEFFQATRALSDGTPDYDEFGLSNGERRLARAVKKANLEILKTAQASQKHKGMGTTVVAASVSKRSGLLHVAHIGDSRCYRLRAGHLESLTQDHSLIVDVLELRPDIDDASLAKVPTNVITRAVGVDPNVRVSIRSYQLDPSDRFLLCSDGLWGLISHREIARIMAHGQSPEQTVEALIKAANVGGGDDNISAVVLFCGGNPAGDDADGDGDRDDGAGPRGQRASVQPNRDESTPDIMVLGIEEVDLDSRAPPPEKQPPRPPPPAKSAEPEPLAFAPQEDICRVCKSHFDSEFCPFCGTRRDPNA